MDLERVEAILKLAKEYGVSEIELEDEASRIVVRMTGHATAVMTAAPALAASAPQAEAASAPPAAVAKKGVVVESPMVGTFYRAAKPGAPPYAEVGDTVSKGQVLCIIEAMKLMNEIECDAAGVIAEIMVENAQPVQFGQALFRVIPN